MISECETEKKKEIRGYNDIFFGNKTYVNTKYIKIVIIYNLQIVSGLNTILEVLKS